MDMTHQVAQVDAHPQGDFGGIVNLVLGGCAQLSRSVEAVEKVLKAW